jgi:D-alanine transaminase
MTSQPGRIVYLNGEFLPEAEARLSIFDRGFLFGDGIYEVTSVLEGKLIDSDLHMARLERSAREIDVPLPVTTKEIVEAERRLIADNNLVEGMIYLQLTRGAEDRNFLFSADLKPTLVMFTQAKKLVGTAVEEAGIAVKSVPDQRWARRDIKTVCLLPQVMAKRIAKAEGCDEAWMIEDGFVTETTKLEALVRQASSAIIASSNVKGRASSVKPASLASCRAARRVQPGRVLLLLPRVMIFLSPVMI